MSDQKPEPKKTEVLSQRIFGDIATEGYQPQIPAPPPQWFLKAAAEKSGKKPN